MEILKPWLTPEGIALALTLLSLLASLLKHRTAATKIQQVSGLLQVVIQGVEDYRKVASPEEKAKIRDTIQYVADKVGVEPELNKTVKSITGETK